MAFEDKTRPLLAGGQAPAAELLREMVSTLVQERIRAEFERSAFIGSIRAARQAGTKLANKTTGNSTAPMSRRPCWRVPGGRRSVRTDSPSMPQQFG